MYYKPTPGIYMYKQLCMQFLLYSLAIYFSKHDKYTLRYMNLQMMTILASDMTI